MNYSDHIIVTESCMNLRALGRQSLAGRWKPAIIAAVIYQVCLGLPTLILDQLFGRTLAELYGNLYATSYNSPFMNEFYSQMQENSTKISNLSTLYTFLVFGALAFGLSAFFLAFFRGRQHDNAQLFSGFEHYFKAFGLGFMMCLFIFLWTLLFIVPGIIAGIRYSQAFFILVDNPEKGVMQCIGESKRLMSGNKGKYFALCLSFIGWLLLTALAVGIVVGILTAFTGAGFITALITWIANLAMCWIMAYMAVTRVAFYDIVKGNLRAQNQISGQY